MPFGRPFHHWRTVFYLIPAVSVYTVVMGSLSLLSTIADRTGDLGHRCARTWARLILKTSGVRVRVTGLEHIDARRSYVFAANHASIYDIPIVFTSIPMQLRIVAKQSLGRIPFMGWHLHHSGHLLVDRTNPGPDIVEKMKRLVNEQHSLIVFPEGTRSVDGRLGRFKKGSFLVAIDAQLPVVPVSIRGSSHVMKKGRVMVQPGEVELTIHAPIPTIGVNRANAREFAERVREVIAGDLGQSR